PRSTRFPYTTLFRSLGLKRDGGKARAAGIFDVVGIADRHQERLQAAVAGAANPDTVFLAVGIGREPVFRDVAFVAQFLEVDLGRSEEHTSELQSREN